MVTKILGSIGAYIVGLSIILLAWTTYLAAAFGLVAVLGFMAYIQRYQITPCAW
jgi:hypothetical protein